MSQILSIFSLFLAATALFSAPKAHDSAAVEIKIPPEIHFIRAFGGTSELLPPIILRNSKKLNVSAPFGETSVTIEFDVNSPALPALYFRFAHCNALWKEDDNIFLDDISLSRTSAIEWFQPSLLARYYSYRGKISVPNKQVDFKFSGNWKAKLYDFDNPDAPLAETRFFVVDVGAESEAQLYSDFYQPLVRVSPSAWTLEAEVRAGRGAFDSQLSTVVFYRNHRWFEPLVISQDFSVPDSLRSVYPAFVSGMADILKRFRLENVPCQNEYRVLDLTNLAQFPPSPKPIRPPLSDLRRNGSYFDRANEGALLTQNVFGNDDYANVEFTLDPESVPSRSDVFLAGSFNNWRVTPEWQMYYDADERLYKLRQWCRRGRHNYLYATGKYNADSQSVEAVNFEEMEGNSRSAGITYIGFVYYREIAFGGYDALIGVCAANSFGQIRR